MSFIRGAAAGYGVSAIGQRIDYDRSYINGKYRYQILIKNKIEAKGHAFISKFLAQMTVPKDIKLAVDVDPLDIL